MSQRYANPILARAALPTALVVLFGLIGCQSEAAPSKGDKQMKLEITSTAIAQGQPIPRKHTGEADDVSPPLTFSGAPEATKERALICDDPDAPTPEPWVHWVIYKIPADAKGLPQGVAKAATLTEPAGAMQGKNSWSAGQTIGYRGPLPPPGHGTHHYHFKLYALDTQLDIEPGVDKSTLLEKMSGHILAEAQLTGTYER